MLTAIPLLALLTAAKPPPPLPALPPLTLPLSSPIITATLAGLPLTLRIDPATTQQVALNASAARRLDLANPARLVAGRPPERGRMRVLIGKISVSEDTTTAILDIAGRPVLVTLAYGNRDYIPDADGSINPMLLPHDEVRLTRRPITVTDAVTILPLDFTPDRGLVTATQIGKRQIDVIIAPMAAETIATAAAAAFLAETGGGHLSGPIRHAPIAHGVSRPVRNVTFDTPVDIAGFRLNSVPARIFDWSGRTRIPTETLPDDELVATARFDAQRQWAKLAIGNDRLSTCAQVTWRRAPLTLELTCPALP
ncbi:hypothetical protein GCM10011529_17140 [Polymorphobacter glacialis]|uniref:Uncharacterized protein n=1 Tax=Sandarakinorhabdus glacialis TaxID=1614636 RepID=A0A916ZSU4_9SPHN|nr:hypothetical protein [Polymorphobacter glacialis]GGE11413.1 hypothetical protein GCM10011529_17140 [Polymorphobacter glacialis]